MNHTCPYQPGSGRQPLRPQESGGSTGPMAAPSTPDLTAAQQATSERREPGRPGGGAGAEPIAPQQGSAGVGGGVRGGLSNIVLTAGPIVIDWADATGGNRRLSQGWEIGGPWEPGKFERDRRERSWFESAVQTAALLTPTGRRFQALARRSRVPVRIVVNNSIKSRDKKPIYGDTVVEGSDYDPTGVIIKINVDLIVKENMEQLTKGTGDIHPVMEAIAHEMGHAIDLLEAIEGGLGEPATGDNRINVARGRTENSVKGGEEMRSALGLKGGTSHGKWSHER